MSHKDKPILPGAVFCNFASQDESGKINCRDVFTSFLAWAYPTSIRAWHAILTLYNPPMGTSTITASISFGRDKKETLVSADIERGKDDFGNVIDMPLFYRFKQEGNYTVHFNLVGSTTVLKIPVKVITKPWPKFTKSQLEFLRKNPMIPNSIRMNVLCSKCSRPYVFEESVLLDQKLAVGVLPFPEAGVITCDPCGHEMHMKDIQGQLRNSISNAISSAKRGRK